MIYDAPQLSIIIVNYNGRQFLADCLDSIARHVSCPHEVIIVDNASRDGSCDFLRSHYPDVQLIESRVNTGFTGGNNLGAQYARGKLLLLLNNDTRLVTDLSPVLRQFDDPQLGVLGCRLRYGDGRQQLSIGFDHTPMRLVLSWLGLGSISALPRWFRRSEMCLDKYAQDHANVAWVSGACLFTPRALWQQVGGLDTGYFMYVEDVDYCKRVRLAGYRVAYTAAAEVVHYEGSGRAWVGGSALRHTMHSYLRYSKKFHSSFSVLSLRALLAAVMLARALAYGVCTFFSRSQIWQEKNKAYRAAAITLLKGAS
ncbi:MAG TPA: glycosyltransferase family 2 protein [Gallionella sp.]|nr:glycosyltransferase family 2 protein [Gallionella sp.]